jgi:hypothetical protein
MHNKARGWTLAKRARVYHTSSRYSFKRPHMDSNIEFKPDQRVEVAQERGTQRIAYVQGVTLRGQVIVQYQDNSFDFVDREDITI